ncbi:MAG TPA: hypothetical protein VF252_03305 [Gemmatimonadales bacterium]
MSPRRRTPFELIFQQISQEGFPGIQARLGESEYDPRDRDQFLMVREVVSLLRELRPDEGLGEGIDQLAALVHHAYLFWAAGQLTVEVPQEGLPVLLGDHTGTDPAEAPPAYYLQVPERRVWAEVVPGQPPEPLDGCFVHLSAIASLRVLGVFGVHPEREGVSVVEASGPRVSGLAREDGSSLFEPVLAGGKAARLFSLISGEELLELGWRSRALAQELPAGAGPWRA